MKDNYPSFAIHPEVEHLSTDNQGPNCIMLKISMGDYNYAYIYFNKDSALEAVRLLNREVYRAEFMERDVIKEPGAEVNTDPVPVPVDADDLPF